MVCRTTLIYSAEGTESILSDFSVKLHGALMNIIPKPLAAYLHTTAIQPFSISCRRQNDIICAVVNALEPRAFTLCEAVRECREVTVYGMDSPLLLMSSELTSAEDIGSITERFWAEMPQERILRLSLVSPAMIKANGVPSCPPDIVKYFRSVVRKYNAFEHGAINFEEFEAAFSRIRPERFSLNGSSFNKSGTKLPGLTGFIEIPLPRDNAQAKLIAGMAKYAEYSGLGAKSAMGMGCCTAEWVK